MDISRTKRYLIYFVLFESLIANNDVKNVEILGPIDQNYLIEFRKLSEMNLPIRFGSTGGDAEIALDIAEKIKAKGKSLTLHLRGVCLSACAEIILPAAAKYSNFAFVGTPTIGYHHNSEIFRRFLKKGYEKNSAKCAPDLNKKFLRFTKEVGIYKGALLAQILAIEPEKNSGTISADCSRSEVKYARKFWFPTSDQLKYIYGINVPKDVCADDKKCIEAVIILTGENGYEYVVGSTIYKLDKLPDNSGRLWKIGSIDFYKLAK